MCPFSAPKGFNLSLFSFYGQRFPRYWPSFKTAILGHETWNLKKKSRSCISILSVFNVVLKFSLLFALLAAVSEINNRSIFKIPVFGHEIWNLENIIETVLSFYPQESKLCFFRSMGRGFWDATDFQIFRFGYETFNLKNVPEVAYVLIFPPPGGRNWVYLTGSQVEQFWLLIKSIND